LGVAYYELLALFLRFRYLLLRNMVAFLSESVLYSSMTNADEKIILIWCPGYDIL